MFAGMAVAQPIEDKLAALQYPRIAGMVRVQGDVGFAIDAGAARVLSGNQMLATGAIENARMLVGTTDPVELLFHYQLVDAGSRIVQLREPKGDAFDRLILRLLHRPTFRMVDACAETRDNLPPARADLTTKPIEVWIYEGVRCLQTVVAY